LHHAYGAVEGLMLRIARVLEGSEPTGPDWHAALLHDMALEIPGVRPALFAQDRIDPLRRLLGFRHFFRHAYVMSLDGDRLDELRRVVIDAASRVETDVARFDAFLAELSEQPATLPGMK
jgi:hypothetical protein